QETPRGSLAANCRPMCAAAIQALRIKSSCVGLRSPVTFPCLSRIVAYATWFTISPPHAPDNVAAAASNSLSPPTPADNAQRNMLERWFWDPPIGAIRVGMGEEISTLL